MRVILLCLFYLVAVMAAPIESAIPSKHSISNSSAPSTATEDTLPTQVTHAAEPGQTSTKPTSNNAVEQNIASDSDSPPAAQAVGSILSDTDELFGGPISAGKGQFGNPFCRFAKVC
ncbi:hypothetical protein SCHPADRAFT_997879 [Schizopora paradoxa]|uniref:Uncharacterized protein n=1 Tax=Schizopora paradoxa TaxID=27342 RepID=A0A0H2RTI2_9AGAM|nr:hypothetical protein SCHPADRAFT_997879 [Schizopora paradoxa]